MLNYVHFGTRFSWYDFHNCLHLTSDRKLTLALLASIVKSNLKAILFEKYTKKALISLLCISGSSLLPSLINWTKDAILTFKPLF